MKPIPRIDTRTICVLAQSTDGKVYQAVVSEQDQQIILGALRASHSPIQFLDTPIRGIELEKIGKEIGE